MNRERRVVNNRVFLLGLDDLYREAMKAHERAELLRFARESARVLSVPPADVPIEGYYSEDELLAEYFRLLPALQQVPARREREPTDCDGFRRLKQLTQSGLLGRPQDGGYLLPAGEDSLSVAMKAVASKGTNWSIENLTAAAREAAVSSDDFSLVTLLVTLAALSKDPVVIAALRESSVLYAAMMAAGSAWDEPEPQYVWEVDETLRRRAENFVATFNAILDDSLPRPVPENAREFWTACKEWQVVGRCVRIGFDGSVRPIKPYHWAIHRDGTGNLMAREFWDTDIWTTEKYRDRPPGRV